MRSAYSDKGWENDDKISSQLYVWRLMLIELCHWQ